MAYLTLEPGDGTLSLKTEVLRKLEARVEHRADSMM